MHPGEREPRDGSARLERALADVLELDRRDASARRSLHGRDRSERGESSCDEEQETAHGASRVTRAQFAGKGGEPAQIESLHRCQALVCGEFSPSRSSSERLRRPRPFSRRTAHRRFSRCISRTTSTRSRRSSSTTRSTAPRKATTRRWCSCSTHREGSRRRCAGSSSGSSPRRCPSSSTSRHRDRARTPQVPSSPWPPTSPPWRHRRTSAPRRRSRWAARTSPRISVARSSTTLRHTSVSSPASTIGTSKRPETWSRRRPTTARARRSASGSSR